MLIPSPATNRIAILVVSAILLSLPFSLSFGQDHQRQAEARRADFRQQAEALVQEAIMRSAIGDQRRAGEQLSEAIRLYITLQEPDQAARSALLVGDSYLRINRFLESLDCYHRALAVKPLSAQVRSITFNSIARLYAEIYELELAKRYYRKAADDARDA